MGLFNRFPYTNFHALNLDWLINKVKDLANSIPTKVSQLENDSGYITSAQSGAVDSINGMTGAVVLDASDVGALPDNYSPPVTSVNAKTGAVVLDASDVGAMPNNYSPPVTSVNTKTGAVVLDASDVGAMPDDYTAPVSSVNGHTGVVVLDIDDMGSYTQLSATSQTAGTDVTIHGAYFYKYGKLINIQITFTTGTALANGDTIAVFEDIPGPLLSWYPVIRSSSAGTIAGCGVNRDGSNNLRVTASGALQAAGWWGLSLVYLAY